MSTVSSSSTSLLGAFFYRRLVSGEPLHMLVTPPGWSTPAAQRHLGLSYATAGARAPRRGGRVATARSATSVVSATGSPAHSHSTAALAPCQRSASDRRVAGPATSPWASIVDPPTPAGCPSGNRRPPGGEASLDRGDRGHVAVADPAPGRRARRAGRGSAPGRRALGARRPRPARPRRRRSAAAASGDGSTAARSTAAATSGTTATASRSSTRPSAPARPRRAGTAPGRRRRPPVRTAASSQRAARTASTTAGSASSSRLAASTRAVQPRATAAALAQPGRERAARGGRDGRAPRVTERGVRPAPRTTPGGRSMPWIGTSVGGRPVSRSGRVNAHGDRQRRLVGAPRRR